MHLDSIKNYKTKNSHKYIKVFSLHYPFWRGVFDPLFVQTINDKFITIWQKA